MAKTQELLKGKDYEAISNSIKETVGYSSALSDAKNFTLTRDMQYAQLVAAKQFEDMDITLNEELDYLKMIEENTAKTVDALTATLAAIGDQISNSINNNSSKFDEYAKDLEKITGTSPISPTSKLVQDIYSKYDLHKYQTDTSGYAHLSQDFAAAPTLSNSFITEQPPVSRVLAVATSASSPEILMDAYIQLHCARPMPMYGVPGLTRL